MMKKRLCRAIPFTIILALLISCSNGSGTPTESVTETLPPTEEVLQTPTAMPENTLNLSSYIMEADYLGNIVTGASIDSNVDWTLSSDESWVTVENSSGSGAGDISITVEQHIGEEPRTANIIVEGAGKTQSVILTQTGARQIYYKENIAGDENNTLHVDQDGIEWLAATRDAYVKVEGYIDLTNAHGEWPEDIKSAGAPLYAYYAKPGVFDAGIFCSNRNGRWYGCLNAIGESGHSWAETNRAISTDVVFLSIEVTGNVLSYKLYEVTDYGLESETMEQMTFTGARVSNFELYKECEDMPIYQMATIAFHENNDLAIPIRKRDGISSMGLRFMDTTLFDSDGNETPWNIDILNAVVWGRTSLSTIEFDNPNGDFSDITVTKLTFNNGLSQ